MKFSDAAPNDNTHYFIMCADNSSNRFIVYSDGDVQNDDNSYGGTSDVKLKENIVDAKSQWDDIKSIKVRNFNFKTDTPSDKRIGVVAQEIETVCPSLVDEHPDTDENNQDLGTTTKSVKYSILYMKAIKALQEAMAKIETLEAKVAALEAA
jgi:chemotaxis receptor (MCP) glutamine deamidase CheD